ncbi:MAG TPA: methyltransferase domain-containing protein [Methanosarcinaceae archaeon]|nr:methyltransferase domain-containing protein [Methanosarcinaceae archaeon]
MLYAFELSGEHEDLPRAEVLACLDIVGAVYSEHAFFDQCLVVDIGEDEDNNSSDELIEKMMEWVAERLSFSHYILKVAGICDTDIDTIIEMAENSDIDKHIVTGETYVVRAKRIKHHTRIHGANLEGRVGGSIYRKGYSANMKNPDVEFRLILTERCVFGSILASIDRSAYETRSPQKKPFFYPGVLMPRMARALVNFSKARDGDVFLDPFCGTAGILVEAGLIGADVMGLDVQEKIIGGAQMNLEAFLPDHSLFVGDACRLPLVNECVDAIVTDPPYGRSAAIKAESLNHLYAHSFAEMYRVLKSGKIAVVVSEQPVDGFACDAGFVVKETYLQKVHKSLTRIILVLFKE